MSLGHGVLGQRSLGSEYDQMYFIAMHDLFACDDMITFPSSTRLQVYLLKRQGQWAGAYYSVGFVHE